MTARLQGKVALATGAGSGIGRAAAQRFAGEGAKVAVADIDEAGAAQTVALIRQAGGEALAIRADVRDPQQVQAMVARTVEHYGRLDCAFNNAGHPGDIAATADCTLENWQGVVQLNLTGTWLCMKYELQHMLGQGGGAIVNNASILGLVADARVPAYVAAKHGILGLTKAGALEYGHQHIRVNAICPGVIRSEGGMRFFGEKFGEWERMQVAKHPIGRLGEPGDPAAAAVWLCTNDASFVTGLAMPVDGGYTVV